jgi:hypothetical protein
MLGTQAAHEPDESQSGAFLHGVSAAVRRADAGAILKRATGAIFVGLGVRLAVTG